jgi:hypothetical protein
MKQSNTQCCCTHRIRLEKLKQKTWLLIVFAKFLFFLTLFYDGH